MSDQTQRLIAEAAAALKAAGAREVFVFGSAARGILCAGSDLDLAVSGLPPGLFYRVGAQLSDRLGLPVDLVDLDSPTPFTRYLQEENELVRAG